MEFVAVGMECVVVGIECAVLGMEFVVGGMEFVVVEIECAVVGMEHVVEGMVWHGECVVEATANVYSRKDGVACRMCSRRDGKSVVEGVA